MTSPPNPHHTDDCPEGCTADHAEQHREAWADHLDERARDHQMMERFYDDD